MDDGHDMQNEVEVYRKLVLSYEALDEQIDSLLMKHGGTTDKMPPEDLQRYRELARQRDDLFNEMRAWEQTMLPDEDDTP